MNTKPFHNGKAQRVLEGTVLVFTYAATNLLESINGGNVSSVMRDVYKIQLGF